MFNEKLTSTLTGVTLSQLRRWRHKGLIVPEVRPKRPPIYSFRDLVALRYLARLRERVSLQKIGTAIENLDVIDLTDHPASYRFGTDGKTIFVEDPRDSRAVDLITRVAQPTIFTFEELIESFTNFRGDPVVNFENPSPGIRVIPRRLGGIPTIENTRIPYTTIVDLLKSGDVQPNEVAHYFPQVDETSAIQALDFDKLVNQA